MAVESKYSALSSRLALWQNKYLSKTHTLPNECQLIYIIAMDMCSELASMNTELDKQKEALEIIAGYDNDQYRSVRTLLTSAIKVAQMALRNPDGSWTTR